MSKYQAFIDLFNTISREKHRYTVFSDFVTIAAISLHSVFNKVESLQTEHKSIIERYTEEEVHKFDGLFDLLVNCLEEKPHDCLGNIYMELGFGEHNKGQFFTPEPICDLMSQITVGDGYIETIKRRSFVALTDPACGAGAMILSVAKYILNNGYSLEQVMYVEAIDINRLVALMCYCQLTLWNIPAKVVVGNSLTQEYQEYWYTLAYVQYGWFDRLEFVQRVERFCEILRHVGTNTSIEKSPEDLPLPQEKTAPLKPIFDYTIQPKQDSFDF